MHNNEGLGLIKIKFCESYEKKSILW